MMESMEHSEVRELLEDAAIEPGGLERLMAGDTPTASIVAGHLAGCADCSEELERLRRSVGLIRPTVQLVPPPELKERTLAYVAALGRPRSSAVDADPAGAQVGAPIRSIATAAPTPISTRWRPGRRGWLASVAAALIVAFFVRSWVPIFLSAARVSPRTYLASRITTRPRTRDADTGSDWPRTICSTAAGMRPTHFDCPSTHDPESIPAASTFRLRARDGCITRFSS
jgi:hypothetical protein